MSTQTILFAGPSLTEHAINMAHLYQVKFHPPIKRLDLPRLLTSGFTGNIVIADGLFHQALSVGHREIRDAIAQGCTIFGLASMGAIRSYEMSHLGVRGFGKVYNWFVQEEEFDDDEVTLIHETTEPYRAISEPMVHFRECLKHLVELQLITTETERYIVDELKQLYYGERTMFRFKKLLQQHHLAGIDEILKRFDSYRIKQIDLEQFLEQKAWLQ